MLSTAVLLVIGEILCFAGQDFFHKCFSITHPGKASAITAIFNTVIGVVTALGTWVYAGFHFDPDTPTIIIGFFGGVALFLYYYCATCAAQRGPFTLQSMMSNFGNILIPLMISVLIWGDHPGILQYVGIFLMLAAFYIYNRRGLKALDLTVGDLIWFFGVFLMNGVYSSLNDMQHRVADTGCKTDMIIVCFATSAIISIIYCFFIPKEDVKRSIRMPGKALLFVVFSSLCAAFAINLLMAALVYVPSYLLYPIGSGALMVINAVLSRFALKENITFDQYAGMATAVLAIVLANIT